MKNKHMKLDDRIEIQECLTKGMTFKAISAKAEPRYPVRLSSICTLTPIHLYAQKRYAQGF